RACPNYLSTGGAGIVFSIYSQGVPVRPGVDVVRLAGARRHGKQPERADEGAYRSPADLAGGRELGEPGAQRARGVDAEEPLVATVLVAEHHPVPPAGRPLSGRLPPPTPPPTPSPPPTHRPPPHHRPRPPVHPAGRPLSGRLPTPSPLPTHSPLPTDSRLPTDSPVPTHNRAVADIGAPATPVGMSCGVAVGQVGRCRQQPRHGARRSRQVA